MGEEGFAPSDEAIDLAPLIRGRRQGTWNDMPKGWSGGGVIKQPIGREKQDRPKREGR